MLNILQLILENIQMNTNTKILHPKIHIVAVSLLILHSKLRIIVFADYAIVEKVDICAGVFMLLNLGTHSHVLFLRSELNFGQMLVSLLHLFENVQIFYIDGKFYIVALHLCGCSRGKLNKLTLNSTSFTITS